MSNPESNYPPGYTDFELPKWCPDCNSPMDDDGVCQCGDENERIDEEINQKYDDENRSQRQDD